MDSSFGTLNEAINDILKYNDPIIMTELAKFLKSKGHECAKINGIINHTFTWCQKDICNVAYDQDEINEIQAQRQRRRDMLEDEIMEKFSTPAYPYIMNDMKYFLNSKNHTCPRIIQYVSSPVFRWCGKDECQEIIIQQNEIRRQQEEHELVERLAREGHTCVFDYCTAPSTMHWCNRKVCVNAKR